MLNHRKVSQERVIGISLVDILIQAVFVLLLVLMVGYIDPVKKQNLEKQSEYGQVGKDLCHKLNKNSIEACREVLPKVVLPPVVGPPVGENPYTAIGNEICRRVKANDADDCKRKSENIMNNASLFPCLAPDQGNIPPKSTKWEYISAEEIKFLGFTSDYKNYINKNNDVERIKLVFELENFRSKILKISNIESSFGFIKEKQCFHSYNLGWTGRIANQELTSAYTALNRLTVFARIN